MVFSFRPLKAGLVLNKGNNTTKKLLSIDLFPSPKSGVSFKLEVVDGRILYRIHESLRPL